MESSSEPLRILFRTLDILDSIEFGSLRFLLYDALWG